MKKILVTILSLILVLSCFACADKPKVNEDDEHSQGGSVITVYCDVYIRDAEGVDKCLWEDGKAKFRPILSHQTPTQTKKSAVLYIGVEYDMFFYQGDKILDFISVHNAEFDCDKKIFEITENSDNENHFILKVLQSCVSEEIIVGFPLKGRDPDSDSNYGKISFSVTTEEE